MSKINTIKEKIGLIESQSKTKVKLTRVRKLSKEQLGYYGRLQAKLYSSFTELDWETYFNDLYIQVNCREPRYTNDSVSRAKRKSVITRVLKNYTPMELKGMIDFLFLANHDIKPKPQITLFLLSGGFLEIISVCAHSWESGDYKTTREANRELDQHNAVSREWDSEKYHYTENENSIL